jgi:hypothetical protein
MTNHPYLKVRYHRRPGCDRMIIASHVVISVKSDIAMLVPLDQ